MFHHPTAPSVDYRCSWTKQMLPMHISVPYNRLAEFCQRHHVRKLSLFSSVLRDDFRSESDIDVLVEFAPGKTPGFTIVTMQQELALHQEPHCYTFL